MIRAFFFSLRSEEYILITQCTPSGSLPASAFSELIGLLGGTSPDYTFVECRDWQSSEYFLREGLISLVDADVRPFIIIPVSTRPAG